MTRFGIYIGGLLGAAALILISTQMPSCALTPQQQARILRLSEVGLEVMAKKGILEDGDRVLVGRTVAVLTSGADGEQIVWDLAEIGLQVALEEGVLKSGETLVIQGAESALVLPADAAGAAVLECLDCPRADAEK